MDLINIVLLFQEIFLEFNNITNFSLTHIFNLQKIQSFTELDYLDLKHNFIKDTTSPVSTCNRNLGMYFMS